MKRLFTIAFILLSMTVVGFAQDTTTTGSTVNFYFTACENQGVVDFTGNMLAGYDLYVQVFSGSGGTDTAISPVVRVPVNGAYQVSQIVTYNSGTTLALGQFASAKIIIARESNPESTVYTDTADDVQDGCAQPAYTAGGGITTGGSTPLVDPITGEVILGEPTGSSGIFTPDGGVLNETYAQAQEAIVQIGARPSYISAISGRASDAGWIFAECDAFPLADPGRLFDTDVLVVFWSWFASTPALVREHIATAQYEVFLTSDYGYRQVFPDVQISDVVRREDGNYWVFYSANLGDGFRPGEYRIDYYVTWSRAISDGYDEFGPETDYVGPQNTCTFNVEINPFGIRTDLNNPTNPLQR